MRDKKWKMSENKQQKHESKERYNFIQGNNRGSEGQIHELVVERCKVSDRRQMESIPD
ncbi:hypothetical protein FHG87_025914, partial [Trinorchestia longiramus]